MDTSSTGWHGMDTLSRGGVFRCYFHYDFDDSSNNVFDGALRVGFKLHPSDNAYAM